MKLNIDLGYILKRLIVIGLGFILISQLKSCDVFAMTSLDITEYYYNRCQGFYYNNNTYNSVYGTATLDSTLLPTRTYCSISNWNTYPVSYYAFLLNKNLMGQDAPTFEVGKKYNFKFNVEILAASPGSLGPNNLQIAKIGFNTQVNSNYNVVCNFVKTSTSYNDNYESAYNYEVTCNDVTLGDLTSWSNLRFWFFVDNYKNGAYDPSVFSMFNVLYYEESVSNSDIQNDLNDSDVSQASQNGNSIFDVDENGQSTNPNVSNYGLESVLTAPIQILERATDTCAPLGFTIFQKYIELPCGDALFWNRDFSSQSSIFTKGQSGSGLNSTRDTFRAFWNLFFGGAVIFHLLTILYEVCQKAIDPFDDTLYTISDSIDARSKSSKVIRDTDGDSSRFANDMNSIKVGGLGK